jgi:7,8-dihydropterin-6-yl-methyl-4-(beta-D-ribofuranosyl)aminobenzene 5'-phosphate synthase
MRMPMGSRRWSGLLAGNGMGGADNHRRRKMLNSENLKITTVIENTTGGGRSLLGEWGICIFVEAGNQKFLVDTGQSSATCHNMEVLGIDMEYVDAIVLSHNHFDHTGGLQSVLSRIKKKPIRVVAHPEVWALKYARSPKTGKTRYIGIPFRRDELETLGARFELTTEPTWLTEDIAASGEEPMTTAFETVPEFAVTKTEDGFEPDSLADDQSLYIRTELGLVIILGCAHRGMINIIEHARKLMKEDRVYMVIGGTHLGPASEDQLRSTTEALKNIDPRWIGVSHCTGQKVAVRLAQEFGDRFFFNNAGTVVRFPHNGRKV